MFGVPKITFLLELKFSVLRVKAMDARIQLGPTQWTDFSVSPDSLDQFNYIYFLEMDQVFLAGNFDVNSSNLLLGVGGPLS